MTLGLGSVLASTVSALPWLSAIGRYRTWAFLGTGALLVLNYWLVMVFPARRDCAPGQVCHIGSGVSKVQRVLFWGSVAIYAVALAVSYGGLLYAEHFMNG